MNSREKHIDTLKDTYMHVHYSLQYEYIYTQCAQNKSCNLCKVEILKNIITHTFIRTFCNHIRFTNMKGFAHIIQKYLTYTHDRPVVCTYEESINME